jgi:hypothetical protein
MRGITAEALKRLGTEPYLVVGINWSGKDGGEVLYSDKAAVSRATHRPVLDGSVGGGTDPRSRYKGLVLEVGGLDDVTKVSGGGSSGAVTVKLDDTDGSVKAILNTTDPHKKNVNIYQTFEGDGAGIFLVFEGQINTPIVWSEGDRTVTFNVVTVVEDREVGFSAEEGQFPNLPDDAIGKVWPLCFGTALHVPGLTFQKVPVGTILTNILVPDRTLGLYVRYETMKGQIPDNQDLAAFYLVLATWAGDTSAADAFRREYDDAVARKNQQIYQHELFTFLRNYQYTVDAMLAQLTGPVTNGYTVLMDRARYFPQDQFFYARVGDFVVGGTVHDDVFTFKIIQPPVPTPHPFFNADGTQGLSWLKPSWTDADISIDENNREAPHFVGQPTIGPHGESIPVGYNLETEIAPEGVRVIPAGTTVTIISDVTMEWIVNIIPSTVLQVWAYKSVNNLRRLAQVPRRYWRQGAHSYGQADPNTQSGGLTAVTVTLKRPLSGYAFQSWEDQIYVDVQSTVGPDILKVMKWLIENYTTHGVGASIAGTTAQGPAVNGGNFWLEKRGNILAVLGEIAYQALYALFLKNGVFEVVYLPGLPQGGPGISEDDIEVGTLQLSCTPTEEIVTKIRATFKADYAVEATDLVIVRNNIDRYGIVVQETEFYIYRNAGDVKEAATYWICRLSQAFKILTFKTFLTHLDLETFDSVQFAFANPWASDGGVGGVVQSASYDSLNNDVTLVVWLPVPFGSMESVFAIEGNTTIFFPFVGSVFDAPRKPAFYAGTISGFVPLALGGGVTTVVPRHEKSKREVQARDAQIYLPSPGDYTPLPPDPGPEQPVQDVARPSHLAFDDKYPTPGGGKSASSFPGKVVSKDNPTGNDYTVDVYKLGTGDKASTQKGVKQLQVAPGDTIPPGTWCVVLVVPDKKGIDQYYMQIPVWLE